MARQDEIQSAASATVHPNAKSAIMPLQDHFRPPLTRGSWWEGFLAGWPAMNVIELNSFLPPEYAAEPRVQLSSPDGPDFDEYEVRVHDIRAGRRLVAAVEIVSPANKDRPDHRRAFVAKCAALLQARVSVVIIDVVTTRHFNLYRELLEWTGHPTVTADPPSLYATACRTREGPRRSRLEAWDNALEVGRPLPTLPLWLTEDLAVPLDLERTYETTCRALRIA